MGLFSRKSPRRHRLQHPATVVLCTFRELAHPDPLKNFDPEYAYAYRWNLATPPFVGQWAIVDGYDGPATVIVGKVGANSFVRENGVKSLASIIRVVPVADIARAQVATAQALAKERAAETDWLERCRWAAGFQTDRPTGSVPTGLGVPSLPEETADPVIADQHGSVWWRAYKKAEELQHQQQEVERFREIARAWYRIRDASAKAERLSSVTSTAQQLDLDQAIRSVERGKDTGDLASQFLGQPLWDWLRYAEELSKSGGSEVERALALVYALITIAEREAVASGREPAPAYTERAAILHRKRREYNAEVAVIERWERACPPERRGPGEAQAKLAQRLIKARELARTLDVVQPERSSTPPRTTP